MKYTRFFSVVILALVGGLLVRGSSTSCRELLEREFPWFVGRMYECDEQPRFMIGSSNAVSYCRPPNPRTGAIAAVVLNSQAVFVEWDDYLFVAREGDSAPNIHFPEFIESQIEKLRTHIKPFEVSKNDADCGEICRRLVSVVAGNALIVRSPEDLNRLFRDRNALSKVTASVQPPIIVREGNTTTVTFVVVQSLGQRCLRWRVTFVGDCIQSIGFDDLGQE